MRQSNPTGSLVSRSQADFNQSSGSHDVMLSGPNYLLVILIINKSLIASLRYMTYEGSITSLFTK